MYKRQVYAPSAPIKLYGQNEVYDTWEPCVMVDGVLRSRLTQRWRRLVLNGTETIRPVAGKDIFEIIIPAPMPTVASSAPFTCTHYGYKYLYSTDACYLSTAGTSLFLGFSKSGFTDNSKLSEYLTAQKSAVNPATIVYQLATPIVTLGDPYTCLLYTSRCV